MKRILIVVAMCSLSSICEAIRIELPGGGEIRADSVQDALRITSNPLAVIVPTGIPTQQSLTAFLLSNPDRVVQLVRDPRYAMYMPVADAMIQGRNAVVAHGGRPLPSHVRRALQGQFSGELLNSVRWTTNWNLVQNTLQAAQMFANRDTQAITLLNAIVFRDTSGVDDIALWAHELHHVQQYADWGVLEFAKRWVDNSSVNGPVEGPAYERQRSVARMLEMMNAPSMQPVNTAADCTSTNASTAICDLYVSNRDAATTFTVTATARATGNGTRSGSMSLLLMHDGATCNQSTGSYGVDNETYLEGGGFSCSVTVSPGQVKRVLAVAPNSRADAVATTLRAVWSSRPTSRTPVARAARPTSANCVSTSASTAYCELQASDSEDSTTFRVEGSARAKSNGTRSGAMRLEMSTDSGACNSGAGRTHGVDNATELRGSDYVCTIRVPRGQTARVNLVAPNSRSDAEWTRAQATW
jgi:hypothetical protein